MIRPLCCHGAQTGKGVLRERAVVWARTVLVLGLVAAASANRQAVASATDDAAGDGAAVTRSPGSPPEFQILWQVRLSGWAHMMIIHEGVVYTAWPSDWPEGLLSAVDLYSGQVLATAANAANGTAPFVVGDRVYSYRLYEMVELNRFDLKVLRRIGVPAGGYSENVPYDATTGCFFVHRSTPEGRGVLSAIRLADEQVAWTTDFTFGSAWENTGSPLLVGDDSVYVQGAGGTNRVWRLDKTTGAVRWVRDVGPGTVVQYNNLIFDQEHDVLYGATLEGLCFALRRSDGALVWSRDPGAGSYSVRSTLSYHRGLVYVPLWESRGLGAYAALDAADGALRWIKDGFFGDDGWSASAVDDRYLYRNTHSGAGRLIVQDRLTGRLVWSADAGSPQPCTNPVQSDGIVVFGNGVYLVALKVGVGAPVNCPWHGVNATGFNPGAIVWDGLPSAVDEDRDQLPDVWEMRVVGHLFANGFDDPDGDGTNNHGEYVAGTAPDDANDHLRLSLAREKNGLSVSFLARPALGLGYEGLRRLYAVERTWAGNGGGRIQLIQTDNLPATGTEIAVPLPLDSPSGFYRVATWLEQM